MSNITADRRVEHDWWQHPIPESVFWGEGFYCETAQIFRFLRSRHDDAVKLGDYVSCYAGCSFAVGENGRCNVGNYGGQWAEASPWQGKGHSLLVNLPPLAIVGFKRQQ